MRILAGAGRVRVEGYVHSASPGNLNLEHVTYALNINSERAREGQRARDPENEKARERARARERRGGGGEGKGGGGGWGGVGGRAGTGQRESETQKRKSLTQYVEDTFYGGSTRIDNTFYREHILWRQREHFLQRTQ
jgi:hypothetical protein